MTDEQKKDFFLKLDQLVDRTERLRDRVKARVVVAEERGRASETLFNQFLEERRRRLELENGGEQPQAGS